MVPRYAGSTFRSSTVSCSLAPQAVSAMPASASVIFLICMSSSMSIKVTDGLLPLRPAARQKFTTDEKKTPDRTSGACATSSWFFAVVEGELGDNLADYAAPEQQHANDEDKADYHVDRLADGVEPFDAGMGDHEDAEIAQLVFQRDDEDGAQHRTGKRAHAADQRHQDHQARHAPVHVGQRL